MEAINVGLMEHCSFFPTQIFEKLFFPTQIFEKFHPEFLLGQHAVDQDMLYS